MEENTLYIKGVCPTCNTTLEFEEERRAVFCPSCGCNVSVKSLLTYIAEDKRYPKDEISIAKSFSSADDAILYFDDFYKSFPWEKFAKNEELTVSSLDTVADYCLSQFRGESLTYVFNFRRLAVPLAKKADGLEFIAARIAAAHLACDTDGAKALYKKYRSISERLVNGRARICEELRENIAFAKKCGARPEIINDLCASLSSFEKKLEKIKLTRRYEEIPYVSGILEKNNAEIAAKMAEAEIDCEELYINARKLINEGAVDDGIRMLLSIKGYKNSAAVIDYHTNPYKLGGGLIEIGGVRFFLKKYSLGDEISMSLYRVEDGKLSSLAVDGISQIIGILGEKVFFLKDGSSICCFYADSENDGDNIEILDSSEWGDYALTSDTVPNIITVDKKRFFVRKKIRGEKKKFWLVRFFSRIKRFFTRKAEVKANRRNNYSLLLVDMNEVSCKTVLPEIVDVTDFVNDKIFYIQADSERDSKSYKCLDLNTEEISEILSPTKGLHASSGGRLIYSEYITLSGSENLYSLAEGGAPVLLAKNIKDFVTVAEGRVLYTVGSDSDIRLYSVPAEGGRRSEIAVNFDEIIKIYDGYVYYTKGRERNSTLMRCELDGYSKNTVASGFGALCSIGRGLVHYSDFYGNLCVCRCDGTEAAKITDSILGEGVVFGAGKLFCIKSEGEEESSLYSMNPDGSCLEKLLGGAFLINEYDEGHIFAITKNSVDYLMKTPLNERDFKTETITRQLISHVLIDKNTGEYEEILTLGEPEGGYATYHTRFLLIFKREHTKEIEYYPIPRNKSLMAKSILPEGAILEEEEIEKARILAEKEAKKQEKREKKRLKKEMKRMKKELKRLEMENALSLDT